MGTLIIFIAMIIVAAIAASVLVSTTTSLQNTALQTGSATQDEVGTALNIIEVYGEDGTTGQLDNVTAIVSLSAGSEPIRLNDLLVSLALSNNSEDYGFAENASNVSADEFGVNYSIEGANNRQGFLSTGDVARLSFQSPRGIQESEQVRISFIPKVGTPRTVETLSPNLILDQRSKIFP